MNASKELKIKSRIVSLDYDDVMNNEKDKLISPIIIKAIDDITFTINEQSLTKEFVNTNLFFYQMLFEDMTFCVCYGFLESKKLIFNVLFDTTNKKLINNITLTNNVNVISINYFTHTVLANCLKRLENISYEYIRFQFDLSDQFSIFTDYSFVSAGTFRSVNGSQRIFELLK